MIPQNLQNLLEKQHYELVGNHSAVKTCHWTRESIRGNGFCYKQKFYNIKSHRCMQMTPVVAWCNHACEFCWRPTEHTIGTDMDSAELDEPKEILDGCIEAQRKLLIGFKGSEGADQAKVKEALEPNQVAISLAGEPTLYPNLSGLIEECKSRKMTTFLVTNGTNPEVLEKLTEPTQLYITLPAPNESLYKQLCKPKLKNTWKAIQKSLDLLKSFSCSTVIRLTLLRKNMVHAPDYAKIIEKANPKYVECKAYMHVGFSKHRLPRSEMPLHSEIKEFAGELGSNTSYSIKDEKPISRVVLLAL